jgi:uncharacterized SAM-binding protein YcdF (DUF218 family)
MLKWLNPFWWLFLLVVALAIAFVVASAVFFVFPHQDRIRRADAVVVLAGGQERLRKGLALIRSGVARTLVIDDGRNPTWPQANRVCARPQGFAVICFKAQPFSTRGEAQAIARLARTHRWRRLVVVTSTYHVTRARKLVHRCFRNASVVGARPSFGKWLRGVVYEWPKLAYAVVVRRSC